MHRRICCALLALAGCQGVVTGGGGGGGDDGGRPDAGHPLADGGPGSPDADVAALCDYSPTAGPARTLPAPDDPRGAKAIYDEFFGQYLPTYDQFGWEAAPWLTADWANRLHFPTPPAGLGNEVLHNLFDFNPFNFDRPGLAGLAGEGDDDALFAATSDPLERLRRYDPTEWMPAVASTYARTAASDVMATQFWFRAKNPSFRPALERALALCPDCDDVFTPLSHDDLDKIIEIRFVRFVAGKAEVSRVFKLIGVDSSGAIGEHTQNDAWNQFGTIGGVAVTAKWRMELSGLITQRYWQSDTAYIKLMPILARASRPAALFQYYDGRFDRAAGAPSDPYARAYNPAAAHQCVNDCHAQLCDAGRDVKGYFYVQHADCTCSLSSSPVPTPLTAAYYATGACETWAAGEYATSPSSGACSD